MDLVGMVLGWDFKVQRTRRRWDRLREHALEKKGRIREVALKQLDSLEDKLKIVEEERLSRRDRVRMLREIDMELANIMDLVEGGENWLPDSRMNQRLAQRKANKERSGQS